MLQHLWDDVSRALVRRPAAIWLTTVGVMAPFALAALLLYNHLSYDLINDLPANAPSVAGTRVLQEHFPAGIVGTVTVLVVHPQVDFDTPQGQEVAARLTNHLRDRRQDLGVADVRSLSAPLGVTKAAAQAAPLPGVPLEEQAKALRKVAHERYTTSLGERRYVGTRLELVLAQSPFSHASIENLDRIEQAIRAALPDHLRAAARVYTLGTTASVRDLAAVSRHDRTRIEVLVLLSVFLILVLLLRRLVVPVYLLLSVLFSYYATLGVTFAVFWLLDPHGFNGIDWKVAVFLFTILIAVGEDYNIFLLTRVQEEEKRFGPVRGLTRALTRTGPIISSCGLIMAGTFGSLLGGSLNEMKQLGFALAFGVLLDTFVVRPVLVPAFLLLLDTGRFRMSGWLGKLRRPRQGQAPPREVAQRH
jgi:RND superfamily putative drug exporter